MDIAFFDASDAVSKEWVPQAVKSGAWVIDNSGCFRMDNKVPLIVPEINGHLIATTLNYARINRQSVNRIFSGPNCSTVQLALALKPIQKHFGLKRVVVSTYQSVSGAGTLAIQELREQTEGWLGGETVPNKVFSHQIAFNCIPQVGQFSADGYTSEESKMKEETKKILNLPNLKISTTAVRVPTISCHGESVNIECVNPISLEKIRRVLRNQSGIIVQDTPSSNIYPMGLTQNKDKVECGSEKDSVYVGRIRIDESADNAFNMWIVSDNIRKGAALNAVQIAETIRTVEFGKQMADTLWVTKGWGR
jgi:aspartate-semialdehyde dehydrogenase